MYDLSNLLNILVFNQFQPEVLVCLLILFVLLLLSGFMSGSETSFFSLGHTDISDIKKKQSARDKAIIKLLSRPDFPARGYIDTEQPGKYLYRDTGQQHHKHGVAFTSTVWESW